MSTENLSETQHLFERAEPGVRKAHKRHILSIALDCFDEQGLEATTIEMIRERAASSIGSIYHHFGSKEGLVAALYFAALDDQLALIRPRMQGAARPRQAVDALVQTYLEWVERQPKLARFMLRARHAVAGGPQSETLAERNKERYGELLQWIQDGIRAGEIRRLPSETYASLLIGQSENYCRAWLSGRVKGSPTTYAEVFSEASWRAIAA